MSHNNINNNNNNNTSPSSSSSSPPPPPLNRYALCVHGGAGLISRSIDEQRNEYKNALNESLIEGEKILKQGGTAIDSVIAAVKVLENNPLFNAGYGSVYTHDSTHEMDATIMDGKTKKAGAVSLVKRIKNPIEGARIVMDKTNHIMIVGDECDKLCEENGLEMVENSYFSTENRLKQLLLAKQEKQLIIDHCAETAEKLIERNKKEEINEKDEAIKHIEIKETQIKQLNEEDKKYGTVGAVALDIYGNLAVATSTGGLTNKMSGRVGDSAIIGAGSYANNETCAISTTGHGESFIRSCTAFNVSSIMKHKGIGLKEACIEGMKEFSSIGEEAEGGWISVDQYGNICMPFNSAGMYRGMVNSNKKQIKVYVWKHEDGDYFPFES